jgi:sec-independent protein translocase protein TatB
MFGMGWQEILLILVVAVVVIGPDQLPQVARSLGKLIAQFRRITNDLRDTMNREFNESEDFREFRDFHRTLDSEVRDIGSAARNYVDKEIEKEGANLSDLQNELRDVGQAAHSYIEGEVAKEEAELRKVGEEVHGAIEGAIEGANNGAHDASHEPAKPAPLGDAPGEPTAAWTDPAPAPAPAAEPAAKPAAEADAKPADGAAAPLERQSTRKESA